MSTDNNQQPNLFLTGLNMLLGAMGAQPIKSLTYTDVVSAFTKSAGGGIASAKGVTTLTLEVDSEVAKAIAAAEAEINKIGAEAEAEVTRAQATADNEADAEHHT